MDPATTPLEAPISARIVLATIGKDSSSPFPMIDRMWEIFSSKGIRTVFISVGSSTSSAPDLDIAECLGCPVHAVPLSEEQAHQWEEVAAILKERKREDPNTKYPFSEGTQAKWILPKNIRIQSSIPWWSNGSLDLSGSSRPTMSVTAMLQSICTTLKLKDNVSRIDILKLDTVSVAPGLERGVLAAILDAGFRPGMVLVNWSSRPDVDLSTTIAAGHLQNCGYRLVSTLENKFLYYFTDNDIYQVCSWEDMNCNNPLVNELARAVHQLSAPAAAPAAPAAPEASSTTSLNSVEGGPHA